MATEIEDLERAHARALDNERLAWAMTALRCTSEQFSGGVALWCAHLVRRQAGGLEDVDRVCIVGDILGERQAKSALTFWLTMIAAPDTPSATQIALTQHARFCHRPPGVMPSTLEEQSSPEAWVAWMRKLDVHETGTRGHYVLWAPHGRDAGVTNMEGFEEAYAEVLRILGLFCVSFLETYRGALEEIRNGKNPVPQS